MESEPVFQLFGRFDGPLNIRLFLQPCIAAVLGYLDGTRDAKNGAPPYVWSMTNVSGLERKELIKHGWARIGKVFILAFALDCAFQYAVHKSIHIAPAILIAFILAILPYLAFRGIINRMKSRR
jgi:hypothetical protein